MGQPTVQAQALSALAGAQAALKDPAAAVTYRRALNQARAGSDPAGEAQAALGLGQMLINQGARVEGSQMLHEAGAAARRMGARGASLARRADDLLAGIGPLEPSRPVTTSRFTAPRGGRPAGTSRRAWHRGDRSRAAPNRKRVRKLRRRGVPGNDPASALSETREVGTRPGADHAPPERQLLDSDSRLLDSSTPTVDVRTRCCYTRWHPTAPSQLRARGSRMPASGHRFAA